MGGNRLQDVQWMLNNSKSVDVDTDKEEWEDESQDKEDDDDDDDYDDWLVVWTLPKNMKVSWNDYSQYMEINKMFQTTNQMMMMMMMMIIH